MKKILLATALLTATIVTPVFAADPTPAPMASPASPAMPATGNPSTMAPAEKPMPMHSMKHGAMHHAPMHQKGAHAMGMKHEMPMKGAKGMMRPAHEPSTDQLNQQQLDQSKS